MYIVLVIHRGGRTSAICWGSYYSESMRNNACKFAKTFGWTVYYPTALTSEEATDAAIKEHEETL